MHVMHSKMESPTIDLTKKSPLKETDLTSNIQQKEIVDEEMLKERKSDKNDSDELDDDELPDLSTRVSSALKEKRSKTEKESCNLNTVENTTTCPNDSQKTDKDKKVPEQDSGYLTTPGISSEEENSSEPNNENTDDSSVNINSQDDKKSEKLDNFEVKTQSIDSDSTVVTVTDSTESKSEGNDTCELENQESSKESSRKVAHSGLSQELGALGVAGITPTLSGGPDWMIDLDDGPPVKKPTGVTKLMERLMKHSTKKHGKKGQDIELR